MLTGELHHIPSGYTVVLVLDGTGLGRWHNMKPAELEDRGMLRTVCKLMGIG